MELPLQAGSISHGRVHIPSLPVPIGPQGCVRTPSLRTWGLGYELPQNNQDKGLQNHQPKVSFSTVHRTNPNILLSATSLKTTACVYLTCIVLRKIFVSVILSAEILVPKLQEFLKY